MGARIAYKAFGSEGGGSGGSSGSALGGPSGGSDLLILQALGSSIKGQTFAPEFMTTATNPTDGQVRLAPIYVPQNQTLTGIKWNQSGNGSYTADNNNKVGLYTYSGGTYTLVASSANTTNLFSQGTGLQGAAFSTPYPAAAGLYFAAILYNNSAEVTPPAYRVRLPGAGVDIVTLDFTNNAKTYGVINAQTDLPASFLGSGLTANSTLPWFVVY